MKTKISVFAAIAFACSALWGANFKPEKLTVGEFFENPIGYNLDSLSLSWKLPPIRNGIAQTAYRVVASKSPDFIKLAWDSGKVDSSDSVKVPYGGAPLKSRERLYWRVKVWDENGAESDWSQTAFFEAGLLSNAEWKGEWLMSPEKPEVFYQYWNLSAYWRGKNVGKKFDRVGVSPSHFRKVFETKKPVSARLYVASRGMFRAFVNGKQVGSDRFGTGWTVYKKRVQANAYDITGLLRGGANAVGLTIADGWYSGRIDRDSSYKKPEILAQVELKFADGSTKIIATDKSWKTATGAVVYSDIYDGELFDARKCAGDWTNPNFDDSAWSEPFSGLVLPMPLIEPRRNQTIVVKDVLVPVSVKKVGEGAFIFDFGQNMVGVPVVKIPSMKEGSTVRLRFAEVLRDDGSLYVENYRTAISTDYYVSDGSSAVYEPVFTFHGFRYLEVSGLPRRAVPDESWAGAKVVYNDMPATGSFICSNAKLNKLQSNIQWGQKSNYISVPTDCPQRDERMGWTGDAQVFCPTGAFNMNTNAFFAKWCQDLLDEQSSDGAYPNVAPKGWGFGNPAWGDAGVICPYEIYLAYADKKILAQNYEGMKKWVEFMKETSNNLIRPDIGYGDWLQPSITKVSPNSDDWRGNTPRSLIGTAYFIKCADIVAKSADILGKKDDAKTYRKLAKDAREAFIKEYYKSDGVIATHTQTGYLLALAFDILPPEKSKKAFAKFLEKFDADKRYLDTGFVGTPLIAPVLTKFGRNDLACALVLNEGYPSWIYSINQGATTMWERWNSYSKETGLAPAKMNSFNHYAYGAIGEWLYANVGGLWRCEKEPGYKTVVFAAKPAGGITSAEARLETPYGAALSSWKVEGGAMQWTVVVPPNSKGLVKLPAPAGKSLVDGMAASSREFELGSGRHFIEAELN